MARVLCLLVNCCGLIGSQAVRCAATGALQIVLSISISVSVLRANLAASSAVYMRAGRPKDFGLRLFCP
jgi:hypothetical protein